MHYAILNVQEHICRRYRNLTYNLQQTTISNFAAFLLADDSHEISYLCAPYFRGGLMVNIRNLYPRLYTVHTSSSASLVTRHWLHTDETRIKISSACSTISYMFRMLFVIYTLSFISAETFNKKRGKCFNLFHFGQS